MQARKQQWYIYTIKYYLAIKNNEIMPSAEIWMDLEIIILSEVSQTEKENFMILFICRILKKKRNELKQKMEIDLQT